MAEPDFNAVLAVPGILRELWERMAAAEKKNEALENALLDARRDIKGVWVCGCVLFSLTFAPAGDSPVDRQRPH